MKVLHANINMLVRLIIICTIFSFSRSIVLTVGEVLSLLFIYYMYLQCNSKKPDFYVRAGSSEIKTDPAFSKKSLTCIR